MQNKFINIAVVLFASLAVGAQCSQYIQQVSYGSVPGLDRYLDDSSPTAAAASAASASSANRNAYAAAPRTAYNAPKVVVSYQSQPSGQYGNGPRPSYGAAPLRTYAPSYGASGQYAPAAAYAPGNSYARPAVAAYRPLPKYTVQGLHATELYAGKQSYKAYQSPPQYNTVALPVVASQPVAKVYKPSYAAPAYSSSY